MDFVIYRNLLGPGEHPADIEFEDLSLPVGRFEADALADLHESAERRFGTIDCGGDQTTEEWTFLDIESAAGLQAAKVWLLAVLAPLHYTITYTPNES